MDRQTKEERNHILGMVKKIKASGCNVLLIQKSILRDALSEMALHYLVRPRGCPAARLPALGRGRSARALSLLALPPASLPPRRPSPSPCTQP